MQFTGKPIAVAAALAMSCLWRAPGRRKLQAQR